MTEQPPLPYDFLPPVPSFTVESDDVADGEQFTSKQVYNGFGATGENMSPHLRWSGFPAETKGFAVTCFDPDAPTGSGFWHWMVLRHPGVGDRAGRRGGQRGRHRAARGRFLRSATTTGTKDFGGAAPPKGDPPHRYVFVVHALNTDALPINCDVSPAVAGFNPTFATIARAMIVPVYGH